MRLTRPIRVIGALGVLGWSVTFPLSTAGAAQTGTSSIGHLRVTFDDPGPTPNDLFGYSVAKSGAGVGSTLIIGANGVNSNAGAAYIYVEGSSGWPSTPTASLFDPAHSSNDEFGSSVAVSGNTAVVGAANTGPSAAGAAYIYVKGPSGWPTKPTARLADPAATYSDFFGYSVAVSGNTAVVAAPSTNSSAGAAYIYVKGPSGWPTKPTTTLADPAATANDLFGYSVAVSGGTALVAADGTNSFAGAAYIYAKGSSGWPTKPTSTLADPAATSGDEFGYSVAVSGGTAVVGTNSYAGAAYIYVKGSSGWRTKPRATLADPAAVSDDSFGGSVAVSGNTAMVGAHGTDSATGAAYVYVKGSSGWPSKPTARLADPAGVSGDSFGGSVAVSGNTAAVGADGTNSAVGAAYLFSS